MASTRYTKTFVMGLALALFALVGTAKEGPPPAVANPGQAMAAHEASLMQGKGGTIVMGSMSPAMAAAIKGNTDLFNQLKVESVPFILTKQARTGEVVSTLGALETKALAEFMGVDAN